MGSLKLAKALANGISSAAKMAKAVFGAGNQLNNVASKLKRKILLWCVATFACLLCFVGLIELTVGGVNRLTESIKNSFAKKGVTYTEAQIAAAVNDASDLLQIMEEDESVFKEGLLLLDKDTVMRILKKVAAYNDEVEKTETVTYEYRIEQGLLKDLPQMDAYGVLSEKEEEAPLPSPSPSASPTASPGTETGATKVKYMVSYEDLQISTNRKSIDHGSQHAGADDIFYMRWQPIVVLCSLYVQANYDNWGSYNDAWENQQNGTATDTLLKEEWEEANYYLSNAQIDEVISVYAYEYAYHSDYTHDYWRNFWGLFDNKITFKDFKNGKSAYIVNLPEVTVDQTTGVATRITQYVPVIAPDYIRNSYIDFTYHYTLLESGEKQLTQRTMTVSPVVLVEQMKAMVPHFSEDLFLENLRLLPGSTDLVSYYRDVIFQKAAAGELINVNTSDRSVCKVMGAIVSKNDYTTGGNGNGSVNELEFGGSIYLFPTDGWNGNGVYLRPGSWILVPGEDYGKYDISKAALDSLTSPDNVTKEQVVDFLTNYAFDKDGKTRRNCPLLASRQAIDDFAECLIKFQNDTGASISGMFGIIIQEGGLRSSTLGKENWNFFSYTAGSSWGYGTVTYNGHAFRDYKSKYQLEYSPYETKAVAAFEEQIYLVYKNYWAKGQDTYFKMVWNNTDTSNRDTVYSGISHSYCPPWQDKAMPYSKESHVGTNYYWTGAGSGNVGWTNRCGQERTKVMNYMLEQ